MKTRYLTIQAYQTKDGSLIRELMHPGRHGNLRLSLAEAIVPVEAATLFHRHHQSEEIYHVTAGSGMMTLGPECFPVEVGDTVAILPGTPHQIANTGQTPLKILCCCSPAYSHEDTELLTGGAPPVAGASPGKPQE
jgi:mannose-6-phosphate isomerase-like protein (cupin superfamily)